MEKIGRGRGKQSSHERGRAISREMLKKVEVVYYLTHNGQLEHPHFMEVYLLPNQPLYLEDFIAKLILLRGRGMPYQYSWSCRRSYKNGYVWNDLSENDIIYPSQGTEYILKGSEIVHYPCTETERDQMRPRILGITNAIQTSTPIRTKDLRIQGEEHDVQEAKLDECEEKTSHTSSRGVPFADILSLNGSTRNCSSKKLGKEEDAKDDHDSLTHSIRCEKWTKLPSAELTPRRSSILFQLIACRHGLVAAKGKSLPCLKQQISRGEVVGLRKGVVNLQLEEKENKTFVGKLPLNKSCYKQERNSITVVEEARAETGDEEGERCENGDKSTCIPSLRRKHHKESIS